MVNILNVQHVATEEKTKKYKKIKKKSELTN